MPAGGADKEDTIVAAPDAPIPRPVDPLAPGTLVSGDYRVISVMSGDEIAISYKAEDVNLGVPVLLKEFAPAGLVSRQPDGALGFVSARADADYDSVRDRFLREAQILVRLRHPGIVRAHRVFGDNATKYIILDYEDGQSFDAWLADLGRAPTQNELDRLVTPVLNALASVHAAGYVHADIDPSNILIRSGAPPVLVNFAGACEMSAPQAGASHARADTAFAAPELRNGEMAKCGPWTDLYGLAAVLYLAVTGEAPRATGADQPGVVASAAPGYREAFLKAIDRGLAADIEARPQSVEAWDGIRAPEEPEPFPEGTVVPTVGRDAGSEATVLRTAAGAAPSRTSLSMLATRVLAALPEAKEETDIPKYGFERWLLPAAVASALLGALLFSTGMNFALAAVFQVAATGLFFLRGYMPLSRFLAHTTRQPEAIVRRAEQATRNAAWMMAAILAVMTINPLFVNRFVTTTTALPIAVLSALIGIPALIMAACGYLGMPVRWSSMSFLAGASNAVVVIFNVLLFAAFAYTLANTSPTAVIHPALQVNRYLYLIGTVAAGALGILIFVSRGAARQRLKQAAVSR